MEKKIDTISLESTQLVYDVEDIIQRLMKCSARAAKLQMDAELVVVKADVHILQSVIPFKKRTETKIATQHVQTPFDAVNKFFDSLMIQSVLFDRYASHFRAAVHTP